IGLAGEKKFGQTISHLIGTIVGKLAGKVCYAENDVPLAGLEVVVAFFADADQFSGDIGFAEHLLGFFIELGIEGTGEAAICGDEDDNPLAHFALIEEGMTGGGAA